MANLFKDEFVPNEEASSGHKNWVKANKGEAAKWVKFRDAAIAYKKGDPKVSVPAMATKHGLALVAAGKEHMSVTDLGAVWTTPSPPSDPPGGYGPPVTITSGGTYNVAAQSTVPGQAPVKIQTTAAVTLTGWVRNLAGGGGVLIDALTAGTQLTVENLYAFGKLIVPNNESPTRFLWTDNHQTLIVRRCHFENTAGIEINGSSSTGTVLITQNRCRNIQGYVDNGAGILRVGNFVQFRNCATGYSGGIEISWNEIINEYNKSWPEDVISIYHTSGVQVLDNFIQHQSTAGNAFNVSSQNTITIDASTSGAGASNNYVARNQLVDAMGIGTHVGFGGSGNLIENNRIVSDGLLPDGVTKMGNGHTGLFLVGSQPNNHAHGNQVIYWGRPDFAGGPIVRRDFLLTGAAEGAVAEEANNTHLSEPPNESAEWTLWQSKLSTAGKLIGP